MMVEHIGVYGGLIVSISTLQDISAEIINHSVNMKISETRQSQEVSSFSEILSEACEKNVDVGSMFQTTFSNYNVQTKVGNTNVPWKCWDRNDFPVWEYFKKDSSAECLNNWRPIGAEPPQTDRNVQRGLSQINYGEMVILIPESLQKKMETDPNFAEEVLNRVKKWKEDYDREDNAIAASLGYDPELNQLSKSYCIQLDKDGNVGDHTVIGGGFDDPDDSRITIISKEDQIIFRKSVRKEIQPTTMDTILAESSNIDFETVAPYLVDFKVKK